MKTVIAEFNNRDYLTLKKCACQGVGIVKQVISTSSSYVGSRKKGISILD